MARHPYTLAQVKALTAAFEHDGALRVRGSRMGGAFRRCCERLVDAHLLNDEPPFAITIKGLVALREIRAEAHAVNGHMANLMDLQKVEAALAEFPHLAERAAR